MLKIRLQRRGKKHQAHYRIVVAEAHRSRDSKYIEDLGYYDPNKDPYLFKIDEEKTKKWLKNGAQPTDTVAQFLVKKGILKTWRKRKASKLPEKKKPKKEEEKE